MKATVREMRDDEERFCREAERQLLYPFLTRRQMKLWSEGEWPFMTQWVLADEDQIIGRATFWVHDCLKPRRRGGLPITILSLDGIFIAPENQHRGLGAKLFKKALRLAREELLKEGLGVGGLWIETAEARGFYERVIPQILAGRGLCQQSTIDIGATTLDLFHLSF
ncbi:MAG: GNAT family N-acetyltransferase [Candidatus Nealsonbacteria bacterium]|nr:GNAT family N-acetyltransferase [Candidatus Nealsonbacteria bacterium]